MSEKRLFQGELTDQIASFLNGIGIRTAPARIDAETFLPGIQVKNGTLLVDEEKLAYPGDLLHEAGHLAVAPGHLRGALSDEVELPGLDADALESHAIAWSYAACLHLGIDPRVVFHRHGYKGNAEALLLGFSLGVFVGLSGLEANRMAYSERKAREIGVLAFPKMQKWLSD